MNDDEIIIKKAYTGGAVVIMSMLHYKSTVYFQLFAGNTYKEKHNNIDIHVQTNLQSCSKIIETNAKNGVVAVATSNEKLFFKDHMLRFKIMSLYTYKDLRLKT